MKRISYLYALSPGESDRLRVEAAVDRGHVRSFVVQYEAFLQGRWHPVVRYDTAHGFAHRDVCHPKQEAEKQILPVSDFDNAFTFALSDIRMLWQRYRDGYEKELTE